MSTWVRVAPRSNLRYLVGVPMLLFGVVFAVVVTNGVVDSLSHSTTRPAMRVLDPILAYSFLTAWFVAVWSAMRTGLYASHTGLRVRSAFRRRTLCWDDIDHIEVARADRLFGVESCYTIWVVPTHGRTIETPIHRDDGWRFLRMRNDEVAVGPDEFAETVATLRTYLSRPDTRPL
jgi:hypothetical protein